MTGSDGTLTGSGRGPKFSRTSRKIVWNPLSIFLDPPLRYNYFLLPSRLLLAKKVAIEGVPLVDAVQGFFLFSILLAVHR